MSANCWRIRAELSPEFARVRSSSREFAANDSSPGIKPWKALIPGYLVLKVDR